MIAPALALLAAAFVAGKPVQVACDADVNLGGVQVQAGYSLEGWTVPGRSEIHLHPNICSGLAQPAYSAGFASAFRVVLHEAAHAKGIRSESCAEGYALVYARETARRFYRVPLWSSTSEELSAKIWGQTLLRPEVYRPDGSDCVLEAVRLVTGHFRG